MNTNEIEPTNSSPLDIKGINLDITTGEIVEFIAEDRKTQMDDEQFEELLKSVCEGGAILRGEKEAARTTKVTLEEALAELSSAAENYLEDRALKGDKAKFLDAMSKVGTAEPPNERDKG